MGGFLKYATEMGSGAMIYVHTWFYGHRFRHSKVQGEGRYTDSKVVLLD
jgi:hypothetical protein